LHSADISNYQSAPLVDFLHKSPGGRCWRQATFETIHASVSLWMCPVRTLINTMLTASSTCQGQCFSARVRVISSKEVSYQYSEMRCILQCYGWVQWDIEDTSAA